ncbi:Endocuticle structural glycoprotein SgAbd-1 [Amphibalanus amphitrite]|uniref:Endocuticle structural glycoprotein SgAbd-1 n=1 Tax=Amphibalanus amphitrite TaxID=1232801 RepID=A0A6A4WB12_AMPAM|nr:Endocuticle structural glycoprotein SgAbd-1 [Amphibalanus amphitrite]
MKFSGVDTSNEITIEDTGVFTAGAEPETGTLTRLGGYEFAHPDGRYTFITYVADENGFRAEGEAIPVFTGRVHIRAE